MIRRFYRNTGNSLQHFAWGRRLVSHVQRRAVLYENLEVVFTSLLLVLLVRRYAVATYEVPSGSMMNTLLVGDRFFANHFLYNFTDVRVGDIVVFRVPEDIPNYNPSKPYYVKRAVGLPGDVVEIGTDGYIYRNDERMTDPPIFAENHYFVQLGVGKRFRSATVPEGQLLVFGDNSADSYDSRYWGTVPIENVKGKAFFRYWPVYPWRVGTIQGESIKPRGRH